MSSSALDLACELAARFEGYHKRLPDGSCTTYRCPAGVLTIGYGSTNGVRAGEVWSHDRALAELRRDMRAALVAAIKCSPSLAMETPQRQAVIADFIYNLGSGRYRASTLRKRVDAGDWAGVPQQLMKWVVGGGRKLPGLVRRRQAEIALLHGIT